MGSGGKNPGTNSSFSLQYRTGGASPGQRGQNQSFLRVECLCVAIPWGRSWDPNYPIFQQYPSGNIPIAESVSVDHMQLNLSGSGTSISDNLPSRGTLSRLCLLYAVLLVASARRSGQEDFQRGTLPVSLASCSICPFFRACIITE